MVLSPRTLFRHLDEQPANKSAPGDKRHNRSQDYPPYHGYLAISGRAAKSAVLAETRAAMAAGWSAAEALV